MAAPLNTRDSTLPLGRFDSLVFAGADFKKGGGHIFWRQIQNPNQPHWRPTVDVDFYSAIK